MTFDQAKLYASSGYTLLLPGWKGYFNWNYKNKELIFKDGDYILNDNQLKDKLNLKDSLSDISHQLKTPLTSITIMIDNILDNDDIDTKTRRKFLINIKREIININFLVQNLLKLSKFDANVIKFNKEDVLIKNIVDEAIKKVSALSELKGISII